MNKSPSIPIFQNWKRHLNLVYNGVYIIRSHEEILVFNFPFYNNLKAFVLFILIFLYFMFNVHENQQFNLQQLHNLFI